MSKLAGKCRFDRRRDPVDRIGFLDHRCVVELRRRRIDVATGRNHERHILLAQPGRDRPHVLAFQVDVENGEIEPTFFHLVERAFDGVAGTADLMTQRVEEILESRKTRGATKVLVKWTGYAQPAWEPLSALLETEALDRYEAAHGRITEGDTTPGKEGDNVTG